MIKYLLKTPNDFLDYEWEVEAKGYFSDVLVQIGQNEYRLQFYDPSRLLQEASDYLIQNILFHEKNLVVVKAVNLKNIENAVKQLVENGTIYSMSVS